MTEIPGQPTAEETLARMHDEMPVWTAIAVWTTKCGASYETHACGFHIEPRSYELTNVLDMQLEQRDRAHDEDDMVRLMTLGGVPVAIHPEFVGSVTIRLRDPHGALMTDIQPGCIDEDGPVERDETGTVVRTKPERLG